MGFSLVEVRPVVRFRGRPVKAPFRRGSVAKDEDRRQEVCHDAQIPACGRVVRRRARQHDRAVHTLVIPKVAARNIFDIAPADLSALIQRVQHVAKAVKTGMDAEGLVVQQFNELPGGQVVFHIHFHILPRWTGVALGPHGVMGDKAAIEAAAAKIRAALA
jgi:diadenosine tetraphosphate (Ap4A) HIT family hydrolase